MRRLNTLRLTVGQFHFGMDRQGTPAVQIQIDGTDLYELIRAGGRAGPAPDEMESAPGLHPIEVAPPSNHWLSEPDPDLSEEASALIYNCECGHWPCGGILARIWVTPDEIAWSRFRGPRATEPYAVGPFHFERQDYEQQLRDLPRS